MSNFIKYRTRRRLQRLVKRGRKMNGRNIREIFKKKKERIDRVRKEI